MSVLQPSIDAMINNLNSENADQFDQGLRQAAALASLVQDSPLLASGKEGQQLQDTIIATIGRVLELGVHFRNETKKSKTLKAVSSALAQALVQGGTVSTDIEEEKAPKKPNASQTQTSQTHDYQERREALRKISNVITNKSMAADWNAATLTALHAVSGNSTAPSMSTLDFAEMALDKLQPIDPITGEQNAVLSALQEKGVGLPLTLAAAWKAHLLLHPQMIASVLSSILQEAIHLNSLEAVLHQDGERAAAIAAIAGCPALLLHARKIVRTWLASSGNIYAWMLHWKLYKVAAADGASAFLYPEYLGKAAGMVHGIGVNSDDEELKQQLELIISSISAVSNQEEGWALLLDGVPVTKKFLGDLSSLQGQQSAARWLATLMWPFDKQQQENVARMLSSPPSDGTIKVPLSLQCLERWRDAWASE